MAHSRTRSRLAGPLWRLPAGVLLLAAGCGRIGFDSLGGELARDGGAEADAALQGIAVTTTADELEENGACSLREALLVANAGGAGGGDCVSADGSATILLPPGVYTLSLGGPGEDGGLEGDLDVLGDVAIVGSGAAATVLDGGAIDRVLHVHAGARLSLARVSVTGGRLAGEHGAGIAGEGELRLIEVHVHGNETIGGFGGGLYNRGALLVERSALFDNLSRGGVGAPGGSPGGGGGGGGGAGLGGGLYNDAGGAAVLINSTLAGNTARGGVGGAGPGNEGAFFAVGGDGGGPDGGPGGAESSAGAAGGFGSGGGGGGSDTTVPGSGGDGGFGGGGGGEGARTSGGSGGTSSSGGFGGGGGLTGLFSGAGGGGGGAGIGAAIFDAGGTVTLDFVTITGNEAEGASGGFGYPDRTAPGGSGVGGALFTSGGVIDLRNSVVFANGADMLAGCGSFAAGAVRSLGFNLIGADAGCPADAAFDRVTDAADLGELADNGGTTFTVALGPDSPARGAGDCTDSRGAVVTVDQRNLPRPQPAASSCDIGAYEAP